jgi:hypothetical protein
MVMTRQYDSDNLDKYISYVQKIIKELHIGDIICINGHDLYIVLEFDGILFATIIHHCLPKEAFWILQEKQGYYFYGCGITSIQHGRTLYDFDDTETRKPQDVDRDDDDSMIVDGVILLTS